MFWLAWGIGMKHESLLSVSLLLLGLLHWISNDNEDNIENNEKITVKKKVRLKKREKRKLDNWRIEKNKKKENQRKDWKFLKNDNNQEESIK